VLQQGVPDLVALARAILYEPSVPWHAAAVLEGKVQVPPQYLRSEPHDVKGILTQDQ